VRIVGFPGQGAQTIGMGAELFGRYPELVACADEVLGWSVEQRCCEDPGGLLARTDFCQPALYVVETLGLLQAAADGAEEVDAVLGHSVGEYAALTAAGSLDFETGLRLVHRRGQLMAAAGGGSMAALLSLELAEVQGLLASHGLHALDIALHNAPGQYAVAGPDAEVDRLVDIAFDLDVRCVRLNVSGPFHSRYMSVAATEFADYLGTVPLHDPGLTVLANASGSPVRSAAEVARVLVAQMVSPVLFRQSVEWLLAEAAGRGERFEFVEIGPGSTLTGMVGRIERAAAAGVSERLRSRGMATR